MVALTYLSIVRFSGTDAGDFLHKQISGDVLGLENGDSVFACYCEPRGRVLALMLVCRSGETYYVVMSRSLVQTIASRLKMYVMRSKVNIEVLDEYALAGLEAHGAPETASIDDGGDKGCHRAHEGRRDLGRAVDHEPEWDGMKRHLW